MAHPERPWEGMGLVELPIPSIKSPILASPFTASFLARDPILKAQKDSVKSHLAKLGTQCQGADGVEWQQGGDRKLAVQKI